MLKYETVQKIGYMLGMPYVKFNDRFDMPEDASDGIISISGCAKYIESKNNMPPLLIFTGLLSGHLYDSNNKKVNNTKSIYVINLKTLKPTKKSYRQDTLSEEIKKLILNDINN